MELTTINDVPLYCSCSKPNRNPRGGNCSVGTLSTLDCCGMIWYSIAGDARTYISSRRLLSHHAQNSHIFSISCEDVNGFLITASLELMKKQLQILAYSLQTWSHYDFHFWSQILYFSDKLKTSQCRHPNIRHQDLAVFAVIMNMMQCCSGFEKA